jgi:hypothetical protein
MPNKGNLDLFGNDGKVAGVVLAASFSLNKRLANVAHYSLKTRGTLALLKQSY